MKKTREEIIKNNKDIYLLGYGSLLNVNTHHSKILGKNQIMVKVKNYKRIFGLTYSKEICNDKEYKERFKKTAKEVREDYNIKENNLTYKDNSNALTVLEDNGNYINGLLLKIKKEDLQGYAIREKNYYLKKITFNELEFYSKEDKEKFLLTKSKNLDNIEVFILLNKEQKIDNMNIYYLYQKTCRIGAYYKSIEFGEDYDETTYTFDNKLAYVELNKRIFYKGRKVKIKQNLITINKYKGEKENILKQENKIGIIIDNQKYLVRILLETGETIWIDQADLSLINEK